MGVDDERYKVNRSKLYDMQAPDLMHHKKGKAFQDAFCKTFGLKSL